MSKKIRKRLEAEAKRDIESDPQVDKDDLSCDVCGSKKDVKTCNTKEFNGGTSNYCKKCLNSALDWLKN